MIKRILAGFLVLSMTSSSAFALTTLPSNAFLKRGHNNSTVRTLQQNLKDLGYLKVNATGYFGSLTSKAVKAFQKDNGLWADGIAGKNTISVINSISAEDSKDTTSQVESKPESKSQPETQSKPTSNKTYNASTTDWTWFGKVNSFMPNGSDLKILDIWSGKTFNVRRTYGTNHADCETLTKGDTSILKTILGGSWSWSRRPIVVYYNGYVLPASMAPYPHAGNDKAKATAYTSWRSGNYGGGANLDAVKNNNMHGVIDVHFLYSKTHGSNRVEPKHQNTVKNAADYIKKNY